jgi:hypothetical protein
MYIVVAVIQICKNASREMDMMREGGGPKVEILERERERERERESYHRESAI